MRREPLRWRPASFAFCATSSSFSPKIVPCPSAIVSCQFLSLAAEAAEAAEATPSIATGDVAHDVGHGGLGFRVEYLFPFMDPSRAEMGRGGLFRENQRVIL